MIVKLLESLLPPYYTQLLNVPVSLCTVDAALLEKLCVALNFKRNAT